jgi:hypothetical protein
MIDGARRTSVAVTLLLGALSACAKEKARPRPSPSAALPPSASASATVDAAYALRSATSAAPSAAPAPSGSAATVTYSYDAGVNACRRVYGPVQQPFIGEAALAPTESGVLVVTHQHGVATVTRVVAGDAAAPSYAVVDAGFPHVTSPPCAVASTFSLCMDPSGAIHRKPLETEGPDVIVARGRAGTAFAADVIDGAQVVVVYLAERRTTEGIVTEAYAVLGDGPPLRVSDDGSGTTYVALARRSGGLVALLLDGRVAMTPVHARTLSVVGGRLQAGEDAVIFVGGGAEPNTRGALGTSATEAFALVPMAGETGFGLASIRVDEPPRLDEPSTWSAYLNGLDPAPIAATRDTTPIRVARVRPLEARADGPRGLELGKLDESGAFVSYGLVGSRGRVTSAALTQAGGGTIWLAFTDGTGTWLERRVCP